MYKCILCLFIISTILNVENIWDDESTIWLNIGKL